ncbi:tryptophan 7-halogenase [Marinimicrobium alkaliphilum]|uniref:tryptophan 7-halogenase n=1 Tax=Marinimicrobium alkaliphilum TaxID=2202654 RepID=UPI000DB91DEB|nr:tryptophan 7-halogenase [Marinimicrobium alkaliphilum]
MVADTALKHIAVVGAGAVAHAAAFTLARALKPSGVEVTLVVTPAAPGDQQQVEISQPALHELIGIWGLPEPALLKACDGLYGLGFEYQPLGREGFFLPFGRHGIDPAPASFEQGFFKCHPGAIAQRYSEHFLATQAARRGQFDFPVDDPRSIKSTLRYGLHLDHSRLCDTLADYGERLGLRVCKASLDDVERGVDERIAAVRLGNGERLVADFYIDATGAESRLLGEALDVGFEDWEHWLPWTVQSQLSLPPEAQPQPRARLCQTDFGWERRAGLRSCERIDALGTAQTDWVGWCRAYGQADEALRALRPGRREVFWRGNCLALGDAAGSATPLVLSELHWACKALLLWLELYPDKRLSNALQGEYNRRAGAMLAAIRDFHLAHRLAETGVTLEQRDAWPASLRFRLSLFETQGRLWPEDEEAVPQEAWIILLTGLGVQPARYDRLLDALPDGQLADLHRRIQQALDRALATMPTLSKVLARDAG